jgi:hypothetical protein
MRRSRAERRSRLKQEAIYDAYRIAIGVKPLNTPSVDESEEYAKLLAEQVEELTKQLKATEGSRIRP